MSLACTPPSIALLIPESNGRAWEAARDARLASCDLLPQLWPRNDLRDGSACGASVRIGIEARRDGRPAWPHLVNEMLECFLDAVVPLCRYLGEEAAFAQCKVAGFRSCDCA